MKSFLTPEAAAAEPVLIAHESFEVWAHSYASPEHSDRNEDAAGVWLGAGGSAVLAVADGLGGMPRGADASAAAIAALDRELKKSWPAGSTRAAILDAYERANETLLGDLAGSGTTLVVAELSDGDVRTYNVGDSAAILVGQRGRVKLETIAHSPVGYGIAAGMIDPDSAMEHEDRHYLSNHLGGRAMHVEVGSAQHLAARDTLLLASDGLLDNASPSEIVDVIRRGRLQAAARRLAELCAARMAGADRAFEGKPDDVTFLLLRRRAK